MKKLISISLVLILAGGLLLSVNTKAEAMTGESVALLTASLILLPVISAITQNHYVPPPAYSNVNYYDSYPVQTRVIYGVPGYGRHYERHYGQYWGHEYERGWRGNRGHRGYGRDHYYARGRY